MRAGVVAAAVLAAVVTSAPASAETAPRSATDGRVADTVVGTGTPASCTSRAVVRAVARGGLIRFDCGPSPVTIAMKRTAKVVNTSARVVLDGGGLVTLSGEDRRRILYMNTCDRAQVWTTSHCNDQAEPLLVLKGMRFVRGNSTGETTDGGGGGAVFVRGGRLRILDSTFADNRCDRTGPDVGGAAVRVLDQYRDRPVVVRRSNFTGGRCSNGSALSSIGVSWRISGSTFTGNRAVGRGANPARPGTPGGGSGGAIYMDGDDIHLTLEDSVMSNNTAREGGGAIFFVSNDRSGTLTIDGSRLIGNTSEGFETIPGVFFLGASRTITDSVVR
ncbi:hypothetical protein [Nocardioides pinisoli]|uniref:Right handed beta helix domain-containing protein n=1 Tax=Nocardioides pinisoli TaxID=2950279 RepID=A0ABT1KRB4_9ACTN|nr:hypothetical protein [Nocardioides pinisoli]MCP3420277.1 hypothetical protein [Nocardioides pinisoli]